MTEQSIPNLVFRPARPEDKPRVLEISAKAWGHNEDYIGEVWDKWLADPKGEFTVAELGGTVVALAKLTWMQDAKWWLAGLRVDPDMRLKGIGQAMNRYHVDLVKKLGGRVIRYTTGIRNEGSHRIAERAGFHVLMRFVERVAESVDGPMEAAPLTLDDLDSLWEQWQRSEILQVSHGVYVYDWKAYDLTREQLAAHLAHGEFMGVRDAQGRLAAWGTVEGAQDSSWDRLGVSSLGGSPDAITSFARAMRALAHVHGKKMVEVMFAHYGPAILAVEAAGYYREPRPDAPNDTAERGLDVLELILD